MSANTGKPIVKAQIQRLFSPFTCRSSSVRTWPSVPWRSAPRPVSWRPWWTTTPTRTTSHLSHECGLILEEKEKHKFNPYNLHRRRRTDLGWWERAYNHSVTLLLAVLHPHVLTWLDSSLIQRDQCFHFHQNLSTAGLSHTAGYF